MKEIKENLPWVLLDVAGIVYAISCEHVLSLHQVGKITPVPNSPDEISGVIDFRGQIIQLLNIRYILSIKAAEDEILEFERLMDQRKQDHMTWLETLKDSIVNNKPFSLTTDHHACAFGKWYDNFHTDDTNLMFILAKFDEPHKAIHRVGIDACNLAARGNREGAMKLIERTNDTILHRMIDLFEQVKEAYRESKKEILVVFGDNARSIGIAVDEIVAIEYLRDFDEELIKNTITNTDYLIGTGKRKDGKVVFLLNDECLLQTFLDKSEACVAL